MTSSTNSKLITLQNHVAVPKGQRDDWPLRNLPFYFPIAPPEIERSAAADHAEQKVIRRGTVSQFGGPDLEEVSWSGEFLVPEWYENPRAQGGRTYTSAAGVTVTSHADPRPGANLNPFAYFPDYFINPPAGFRHYGAIAAYSLLRAIMQQGLVVVLSIQDRNTHEIEMRMPVTIRNISLKEVGGEPDTRFYNISFKQYRFLTIRTVPRGGTTGGGRPPRPRPIRYISSPYTTRADLGIQDLAHLAYRDRSQWWRIVRANGGSSGMFRRGAQWRPERRDGPYRLPKGTKYVIPQMPGRRYNSVANGAGTQRSLEPGMK